ncbi:hypothetical protein JXA84_02640 [candidate division WOR-3 bacterium]|nr:hypothetical protein [candidate division WOR-3 bacterium]
MRETELYRPLKNFLEKRGYSVSSEVTDCDIVARKGDEVVIIETKTKLSVSLLVQGIRRKEITESVYLAVGLESGSKWDHRFRKVKKLLRRLELGFIAVFLAEKGAKVEILLHPAPYKGRKSKKKLFDLIKEIDNRSAELNVSGSSGRAKKYTVYRLEALKIASFLEEFGVSQPCKLVELGCAKNTRSVLYNNFYGWFDRKGRGVYSINETGRKALDEYKKLLNEKKG